MALGAGKEAPEATYDDLTLAPDWICEILSPSTSRLDRIHKLPIYAREGVRHAWLVDPIARTLEVFRLEGGRWTLIGAHGDEPTVRAEPFDAVDLDLLALWGDEPAADAASDEGGE
ncbi:MAG: Uma2 family endonuclease [Myxococcales bacterium]|nr:Uma2 family endonuclease [Myxococcales bacterium]